MALSQFGSPEALASEEGKSLGSLIVGLSSTLLKVICPHREGVAPFLAGEYRARCSRRNILVSVEVGGMIPSVPRS